MEKKSPVKWVVITLLLLALGTAYLLTREDKKIEKETATAMPKSQAVEIAKKYVSNKEKELNLSSPPKSLNINEGETTKTWVVELIYDVQGFQPKTQCKYTVEINIENGEVVNYTSQAF